MFNHKDTPDDYLYRYLWGDIVLGDHLRRDSGRHQEDQQSERRHAPARSETHNPEEMIMSSSLSPFSVSSVSSLSLTRGQVDYAQNKA